MSSKLEIRQPNGSFNLEFPDDAKEIFIDGISQMNLGVPLSKLVCHAVIHPAMKPGDIEERRVACTITMPTQSLLAFVQSTLANIGSDQGKAQLIAGASATHASFLAAVASFGSNQEKEAK
ncbi:hypothetical protein [Paraburkholderia nemoris]|uniref:hypothetical protein n=1 Tax=Paraburkholderia nemoris TaxID=2793076 RepID=UPI0038B6FF57